MSKECCEFVGCSCRAKKFFRSIVMYGNENYYLARCNKHLPDKKYCTSINRDEYIIAKVHIS